MENSSGPFGSPQGNLESLGRLAVLLAVALLFLGYCIFRPGGVRAEVEDIARLLGHARAATPAVPAKVPRRAQGALDAMTPQAQAELLLDEAVHNEEGAIEDLDARAPNWRGYLQLTPKLNGELEPALNASDLQVRAAALEIYLAIYDVGKDPASFSSLEQRVSAEPDARPWGLFVLGALGNRGIEPTGALRKLTSYADDADPNTRAWAMEALAILGTNEAIEPLLTAVKSDSADVVRERAACGLAQAGMFTQEQRMSAVPRLIYLAEDSSLNGTTRGYVFHALEDITHAGKGSDAHAWRAWWEKHGK